MTAKRGKSRRHTKPRKLTKTRTPATGTPEQLWAKRRAGARNIAGVRYQLRLTLTMLARSAHGQFPATALTPEGMEDIDTVPVTGQPHRFVQAKEIAAADGILGIGALADFLAHAVPLLRQDPTATAALVTNGRFGGGLAATGWNACLAPTADTVRVVAAAMIDMTDDEVSHLFTRVQLVEEPADLAAVAHAVAEHRHVDPAIAQLALNQCLATVVDAAAAQSGTGIDRPVTLYPADLDASVEAAKRAVTTAALPATALHRIVSPLVFRTRSSLSEKQFLEGVDVRPEHIVAGLDVRRTELLQEISTCLASERLVMIVGSSGSGKSALLWRTAADHADRMRVWRVHELSEADADLLVAAIEQQNPTDQHPVLVCVDDIGRPTRHGWRKAADALLELPGVYLVGAAREEDFATEDALRRAVIVHPKLDRQTAHQIQRVLVERGLTPVMALDEAIGRARGLLMEFLHLITAGRRLSAVLAEQAAALETPARVTELEVVRYVTSAHSVGLDVDSATLQARFPGVALPAALRRLEHEHLLVQSDTGHWAGLHELRSTELARALHERPPPRLADTLALVVLDASAETAPARLPLVLRAAGDSDVIAAAVAERVLDAAADEAAAWLEAARLADIAEHAQRCADVAQRLDVPPTVNLTQWINTAYLSSTAGVDMSILPDKFHDHARQLPARRSLIHYRAAAALSVSQWADRVLEAPPPTRARLLEALETAVGWDRVTADRLASRVAATGDIMMDARVIASIHRGCDSDTSRIQFTAGLPMPQSRLDALRDTWPLLTHSVFEPSNRTVRTRFIHAIDGNESPEKQAADLAVIVLDLIPEAGVAEATVTRYDGADLPIHGRTGPHKQIARENLPPQAVTRWNRAFTDLVEREFASVSLTARLRQQAAVTGLATTVIVGMIDRMLWFDTDDARRGRRWRIKAEQLQRDIASLAAMPAGDPVTLAPLGSPPRTRDDDVAQALEHISIAIRHFLTAFAIQNANDRRQRMRLVGVQLRDAGEKYRTARDGGTPRLSGEPNPLPAELEEILSDAATVTIGYADGISTSNTSEPR